MNQLEIRELSKRLKSKFFENYDTSKLTWFRSGGKANFYCIVNDEFELKIILKNLNKIPFYILGAGSNILIREGGYKGLIIKLGKGFNQINIQNGFIHVGSAILDSNLSKFAYLNSLSNLEFFSGIPGTIGGAIKMNAGCYGYETKNFLENISIMTNDGDIKILHKKETSLSYRKSSIKDDEIVLSAVFKTKHKDKNKIKLLIDEIKNSREKTQPLRKKTSGSTFKNPKGFFAAKLIEDSGCKGLSVGDAVVSQKHANFFINQGNASATDIENLGNIVKEKVFNKFNIILDWEVKIIGDYSV